MPIGQILAVDRRAEIGCEHQIIVLILSSRFESMLSLVPLALLSVVKLLILDSLKASSCLSPSESRTYRRNIPSCSCSVRSLTCPLATDFSQIALGVLLRAEDDLIVVTALARGVIASEKNAHKEFAVAALDDLP